VEIKSVYEISHDDDDDDDDAVCLCFKLLYQLPDFTKLGVKVMPFEVPQFCFLTI
jgi:hypothetical protein